MDPKLAHSLMAGGPNPSGQTNSTKCPETAMDHNLARSLLANCGPDSGNSLPINTGTPSHNAAINTGPGTSQSVHHTRGLQAGQIPEPHGIFTLRPPRPPIHPIYGPDPHILDRSFQPCPRCYQIGIACRCKSPAATVGPSCCTIL
jgi:hypothetical protein